MLCALTSLFCQLIDLECVCCGALYECCCVLSYDVCFSGAQPVLHDQQAREDEAAVVHGEGACLHQHAACSADQGLPPLKGQRARHRPQLPL